MSGAVFNLIAVLTAPSRPLLRLQLLSTARSEGLLNPTQQLRRGDPMRRAGLHRTPARRRIRRHPKDDRSLRGGLPIANRPWARRGCSLPRQPENEAPSVPLHMNGGASFWSGSALRSLGTGSGLIVIAQSPQAEPAISFPPQRWNSESFWTEESTAR